MRLAQVNELVDHDVVDDARREQDALPVEIQVAALTAGAPAKAEVLNADAAIKSPFCRIARVPERRETRDTDDLTETK
jgi:hypothetical protein